MNSTLQNPSLRNGSSGNDPIRAGLAGSRQAQLASFGNDDNALHFKRLLSEYKQSEPVAAPPAPPSAEPPRSAGGSAPSSRPEEKQVQESKLQIRRQQARAADQAQNAKSETSKPADVTSRKLPEARLGESAVETQPEATETPNCPGEEAQQSASDPSALALQLQPPHTALAARLTGKGLPADAQSNETNANTVIGREHPSQPLNSKAWIPNEPESGSPSDDLAAVKEGDGAAVASRRPAEPYLESGQQSFTGSGGAILQGRNEALVASKTPRSADSLRLDRSLSVERGRPDPAATSPASGEIAAPTGSDGAAKLGVFGGSFAQDLRAALTGPQNTSSSGIAEAAAGLSNERFDGVSKGAQPGEPMVLSMSQGLYEPSFAPELGARLSMLAADGVQEAQLHLNPAELGPVAIQIVLEGQQAQISFHAEHAETRLVLEQGLPDLAAALRDAGLTLSGGGVFEQTRDPGGQEQQRNKSEASKAQITSALLDTSLTGPSANAVRPRNSEGMLDLYA